MILREFEKTESLLKEKKSVDVGTIISIVLLLLTEARELLFENGEYKKLKWYQPKRIWELAQVAIRLINSVMATTRR
tara:strand:- start:166 stop:396 length:231 start_codon:yes stop_codon:yes gene_type:complete